MGVPWGSIVMVISSVVAGDPPGDPTRQRSDRGSPARDERAASRASGLTSPRRSRATDIRSRRSLAATAPEAQASRARSGRDRSVRNRETAARHRSIRG